MAKKKIDGIEYEADQQVLNHLDRESARADAAMTEAEKMKAERDKVEAERDAANEELKKMKSSRGDDIASAVRDRLALERSATAILGTEAKVDSMTDSEIRLAIISKASPNTNLDGKSDVYIAARYDAAVELLSQRNADGDDGQAGTDSGIASQRLAVHGGRKDANDGSGSTKVDSDEAYARMVSRTVNGYKAETK